MQTKQGKTYLLRPLFLPLFSDWRKQKLQFSSSKFAGAKTTVREERYAPILSSVTLEFRVASHFFTDENSNFKILICLSDLSKQCPFVDDSFLGNVTRNGRWTSPLGIRELFDIDWLHFPLNSLLNSSGTVQKHGPYTHPKGSNRKANHWSDFKISGN